jgi:hypothetical protein
LETADIIAVAQITGLAELSLCGTNIDDAGVAQLRTLANLLAIDLSESDVSDQCLEAIQALPNLETLCIAATGVSLEGLAGLRLSKLKIIDASYCPGESLDLTHNGFGGMPSLEALSIRGSPARTIELQPPQKLQKLRALDLRATGLRIEGLAKSAPKLRQLGLESRKLTKGAFQELAHIVLLESLVIGTDYQILFLDIDRSHETVRITVNNQEVQVPVAIRSHAAASLAALAKARPGLQIESGGPLTGNIYERRRVYGSASDGSESGGLF